VRKIVNKKRVWEYEYLCTASACVCVLVGPAVKESGEKRAWNRERFFGTL
jgi:hypothetical protein